MEYAIQPADLAKALASVISTDVKELQKEFLALDDREAAGIIPRLENEKEPHSIDWLKTFAERLSNPLKWGKLISAALEQKERINKEEVQKKMKEIFSSIKRNHGKNEDFYGDDMTGGEKEYKTKVLEPVEEMFKKLSKVMNEPSKEDRDAFVKCFSDEAAKVLLKEISAYFSSKDTHLQKLLSDNRGSYKKFAKFSGAAAHHGRLLVTGCLIAHGMSGKADESTLSSLLSSLREMDESIFAADDERLQNFLSNHLEKMVRLETVKTLEKTFTKGKPHGTVDNQKLAEEVFAWIKDEYIGVRGFSVVSWIAHVMEKNVKDEEEIEKLEKEDKEDKLEKMEGLSGLPYHAKKDECFVLRNMRLSKDKLSGVEYYEDVCLAFIIPRQKYGGLTNNETDERENRAEEFAKTAMERLKKWTVPEKHFLYLDSIFRDLREKTLFLAYNYTMQFENHTKGEEPTEKWNGKIGAMVATPNFPKGKQFHAGQYKGTTLSGYYILPGAITMTEMEQDFEICVKNLTFVLTERNWYSLDGKTVQTRIAPLAMIGFIEGFIGTGVNVINDILSVTGAIPKEYEWLKKITEKLTDIGQWGQLINTIILKGKEYLLGGGEGGEELLLEDIPDDQIGRIEDELKEINSKISELSKNVIDAFKGIIAHLDKTDYRTKVIGPLNALMEKFTMLLEVPDDVIREDFMEMAKNNDPGTILSEILTLVNDGVIYAQLEAKTESSYHFDIYKEWRTSVVHHAKLAAMLNVFNWSLKRGSADEDPIKRKKRVEAQIKRMIKNLEDVDKALFAVDKKRIADVVALIQKEVNEKKLEDTKVKKIISDAVENNKEHKEIAKEVFDKVKEMYIGAREFAVFSFNGKLEAADNKQCIVFENMKTDKDYRKCVSVAIIIPSPVYGGYSRKQQDDNEDAMDEKKKAILAELKKWAKPEPGHFVLSECFADIAADSLFLSTWEGDSETYWNAVVEDPSEFKENNYGGIASMDEGPKLKKFKGYQTKGESMGTPIVRLGMVFLIMP